MFSYAARTILSKTLRRILQKYLVDVNIDEVALGGENGWGVVVKNVELREGAVLFSFVSTSREEEKTDNGNATREEEVEKNDIIETELGSNKEGNNDVNSIDKAVSVSTIKQEEMIENNDKNIFRNEKLSKSQQLKKSQTFCFYRRKSSLKEENQPKYMSDIASSGSFYDDIGDCNEDHHNDDDMETNHQIEDSNDKESSLQQNKTKLDTGNFESKNEIEMNQTIEFRVGKGGSIGNLGIRLVGNDRHISVENAFLILEVISKSTPKNVKTEAHSEYTENTDTTTEKDNKGNKLAQMIASLPSIFLSNLTVKIIFVDNDENDKKKKKEDDNETVNEEPNVHRNQMIEIGIGSFSIKDESHTDHETRNDPDTNKSNQISISSICNPKNFTEKKNIPINKPENFVKKRIILGPGNEKGIWIYTYPPSNHPMCHAHKPIGLSWARCVWETSPRPLFSLSGLNFFARVYVGLLDKSNEIERAKKESQTRYYEYYTIDSTAGGYIDYYPDVIEMTEEVKIDKQPKENLKMEIGRSNFHRIMKGMTRDPQPQSSPHLDDDICWTNSKSPQRDVENMNNFIPAPGVAFFFSIADPIEFNIERQSIEAISRLMDIVAQYSKQNVSKEAKIEKKSETKKNTKENLSLEADDVSFPSYMNAQSVFIFGFQISKIALRIQLMKPDGQFENGHGFKFCEVLIHSISMDCQSLDSSMLMILDYDLDIGHIEFNVVKGVCRKQHAAVGTKSPTNEFSVPRKTASIVLDSAVILNSSDFIHNMKDAIQFRMIVSKPGKDNTSEILRENETKTFEIKIGQVQLQLFSNVINDIYTSLDILNSVLFPGPSKPTSPLVLPKHFTWKYYIALDGGVLMYQNFKCEFPSSQIYGEKSPTAGFFLESILNQIKLHSSSQLVGCAHGEGFLKEIVDLPENVRMRIFLYLNNLRPLATALGIKNTPKNTFLGCYSVNKYLSTMVKKVSNENYRQKTTVNAKERRRQEMIAELMRLDNETLEEMILSKNNMSIPEI